MGKENVLFTDPKDFLEWVLKHTDVKDITEEDARILLENFKDHDYMLGTDKKNNLIVKDLAEDNGESELRDIDDVIDTACEWNYEDMEDAENNMNHPKNFDDYSYQSARLQNLKNDERSLDKLFNQTKYSVQIDELAAKMAENIMNKIKDGALNKNDLILPTIGVSHERVVSR